MKAIALSILFAIASFSAMSQTSGRDWKAGYVVQMNSDTLYGELLFDWKLNTLSVKNDGSVKIFSGRQMYYFEFAKIEKSGSRQFYVLPFALNSDYETPTIFELLVDGELALLARFHLERRISVGSSFTIDGQHPVRDFYFLKRGERIQYFAGKKAEIMDIMSDCDASVGDFMDEHKIKLKKEKDLIKLTEYYNAFHNNVIN